MNSEKELLIEICRSCYLDCKFCSSNADENSLQLLKFEQINSILEYSKKLKISKVELSGGEPFTHPDILEICKSITKHQIKLEIYTSGNLKKKGELIPLPNNTLKELNNCKLDSIRFNLQSHNKEVHNLLTNSESFNNTLTSLKRSIRMGLNTEVHIIPLKQNYLELHQTINFLKSLGVNKIKFLRFVAHGRGLTNKESLELNYPEYDDLVNNLIEYKLKYNSLIEIGSSFNNSIIYDSNICRKCHLGKNKIAITPEGQVFPCVSTKNLKIFNFNLDEYSLFQILKSNNYQTQLDKYMKISTSTRKENATFINLCPTQRFLKINIIN